MTTRIAVLGSINMDLVAMAAHPPAPGQTITGSRFFTGPGGKGSNQAIAAARAGGDVVMLGAVGTDMYADQALGALDGAGVDTTGVIRAEGPTGIAHIVVDGSGSNSIIVIPGANAALTALSDTQRAVISGSEVLLLQLELELSIVMEAAAFAHQRGVQVVLTPAPVQPLPDELLANVDLLVLNEGEALDLTDAANPARAAELLLAKTAAVLVTLGERGCMYLNGQCRLDVGAHRVEAIDTTAAGDTFAGALAVSLGVGRSVEASLNWAGAAAALAVQRLGAASSMPDRSEIAAFLKRRGTNVRQ